jgi:integrase/recombinase XerD
MSRSRVQGACRTANHRPGRTKTGGALHPLRHASATHRLEAGVNPRLMQRDLGHAQLATPLLSRHLTHQGQEEAYERLNPLMQGLLPCPP